MKNKFLKISVIAAVALLTFGTIGVTIAGLRSETQMLTNTFEPGSVNTGIVEDGNGTVKKSQIQNLGDNDCLVRVRVTVSPAEVAEAIDLMLILDDKGDDDPSNNELQKASTYRSDAYHWDWSQWNGGDGYVYYNNVLRAAEDGQESVTEYLFEQIQLKEGYTWKSLADQGITGFDITVYEEAVQTEVYVSGEMISALDADGNYDAEQAAKIWAIYEAE